MWPSPPSTRGGRAKNALPGLLNAYERGTSGGFVRIQTKGTYTIIRAL